MNLIKFSKLHVFAFFACRRGFLWCGALAHRQRRTDPPGIGPGSGDGGGPPGHPPAARPHPRASSGGVGGREPKPIPLRRGRLRNLPRAPTFEPWRMAGGQIPKEIMFRKIQETFNFAMFRKLNDGFQWKSIKIMKILFQKVRKQIKLKSKKYGIAIPKVKKVSAQ